MDPPRVYDQQDQYQLDDSGFYPDLSVGRFHGNTGLFASSHFALAPPPTNSSVLVYFDEYLSSASNSSGASPSSPYGVPARFLPPISNGDLCSAVPLWQDGAAVFAATSGSISWDDAAYSMTDVLCGSTIVAPPPPPPLLLAPPIFLGTHTSLTRPDYELNNAGASAAATGLEQLDKSSQTNTILPTTAPQTTGPLSPATIIQTKKRVRNRRPSPPTTRARKMTTTTKATKNKPALPFAAVAVIVDLAKTSQSPSSPISARRSDKRPSDNIIRTCDGPQCANIPDTSTSGNKPNGNTSPAASSPSPLPETAAGIYPARRRAQRARNRVAAAKCRAKSKDAAARLEETSRRASGEHQALTACAAALRDEVLALKNALLSHGGCELVRRYLQSAAAAITRDENGRGWPLATPDGRCSSSSSSSSSTSSASSLSSWSTSSLASSCLLSLQELLDQKQQ